MTTSRKEKAGHKARGLRTHLEKDEEEETETEPDVGKPDGHAVAHVKHSSNNKRTVKASATPTKQSSSPNPAPPCLPFASPSSSVDFLQRDVGRGPYLYQASSAQQHRHTLSQVSKVSGISSRRLDSNVSILPLEADHMTLGVRSPVSSIAPVFGRNAIADGGIKASAEDVLAGTTLCALYMVSGLPKVGPE